MWLHVMIFPPFIAAMYLSNKLTGRSRDSIALLWRSSPRWLRRLIALLAIYMIVIALFHVDISEGGQPDIIDGRFYLTSHGRILRELTEAQYHLQNARVVRGFSVWWMLAAAGALMMLVGSRRIQMRRDPGAEGTSEVIDDATSH
jgi:hypothetical protein